MKKSERIKNLRKHHESGRAKNPLDSDWII